MSLEQGRGSVVHPRQPVAPTVSEVGAGTWESGPAPVAAGLSASGVDPRALDAFADAPSVWNRDEPVVMLVEDDAGDALLVEELVSECQPSMDVRWVRSLAQARQELAAARPDCVLLDLHLPDAQGLAALAAVQQAAEGIAVVVLTGLSEEGTGLAAMAAGAQDYLVKGRVDADRFGRAVRYAIQRKEVERSAAALQASTLHAQENARLERGLLPRPLLAADSGLEVVTRYHPGRAQALLGGDFYDVVQAADGTVDVLIGDVSGHGADEAALGVALRIAWRTLVLSGVGTVERMHRLEEILLAERTRESMFATLTSLTLLPDRSTVRVVRAGHPGFMVRTGTRVEWVEVKGGPALGIAPAARWRIHDLTLTDDAELILFTDGLFEGVVSARGDRLDEDGLLEVARELSQAGPDDVADGLIGRAQSLAEPYGGLIDDVAVLHVRWKRES